MINNYSTNYNANSCPPNDSSSKNHFNNNTYNNNQNLPNENINNRSFLSKSSGNSLDIFGIKLETDDLIILGLLFFLYKEKVDDGYLFIALILLLLS